RREPRSARATRGSSTTIQRRPAPTTSREGQRVRTKDSGGGRYRSHARNVVGLASETDRPQVRWQRPAPTRAPSHAPRSRSFGGSNGGREPRLGLSAHPGCVLQSGPPERCRKTTWKEFLFRHWELIVAADFFTVEVWTRRGLQRFVVLFFIDLSTRKVEIGGIGATANGLWMAQIGRNVTDAVDGIVNGKHYLIHDRDPLFTTEFWSMLADVGVEAVKLPPRSPNLNAYAERFVRSIRESCLDQMILFGE